MCIGTYLQDGGSGPGTTPFGVPQNILKYLHYYTSVMVEFDVKRVTILNSFPIHTTHLPLI